jgi:hypothetical protein
MPPPAPPAPVVPPRPSVPLPKRKPAPPPAPGESVAMAVQPHELIGIDQRAATQLFGTAAERLEKPPATIWRWRSATCQLDLYFYLDLRTGEMRSLHYMIKGDVAGQEDCLKSLAAARS